MPLNHAAKDVSQSSSFKIHSLNNYTYSGFAFIANELRFRPEALQATIHSTHSDLVQELGESGIEYNELGNALVPKSERHEVAYIFDSTRVANGMYGDAFARAWIPVLKAHGPEKTVLRVGDILNLPDQFVWNQFKSHLIKPRDFPRLACEQYFSVYLTNLSKQQRTDIHSALVSATEAYLGYVDCSGWNPLKAGLYLPQVGLRIREKIITSAEDDGTPNPIGYPFTDSGFQLVGIQDYLYSLFLGHRIDNGVPAWAGDDSAISLAALGGGLNPAGTSMVTITDGRLEYLRGKHGKSMTRAGLINLDIEAVALEIEEKLCSGLIYDLRFIEGKRNGVLAPDLNALMYSVQVEFPDQDSISRRYQVGLKYTPENHTSEVVTFY